MALPESDDKKNNKRLQHTKEKLVPQEGGGMSLRCHLKMTE